MNLSGYNCTNDHRNFKIPQIPTADCQPIHVLFSQIFQGLYYTVSTVGIAANFMKAVLTARAFHDWTTTHLYMLCLSISHILFLLSCPFWGFYLGQQYDWQLGENACISTNFISIFGECGSTFFISIISLDMMICIYFPVASIYCRKRVVGFAFSSAAWTVSSVFASLGLVFTTFSPGKHSRHFCMVMQVTALSHPASIRSLILFTSSHLLTPVLLVLPCYAKIMVYVFQPFRGKIQLPKRTERALQSDLIVITLFLICCFITNCCLLIGCLLFVTSTDCHDECWWASVINTSLECSKLLNIINASLCPFIYLWHSIKTQCRHLGTRRANGKWACDCSGSPKQEAPAVELIFISRGKEESETNHAIQPANDIHQG